MVTDSSGTVVVGVDGSHEALLAVEVAAGWAARTASPLHIVHAWVWPLYTADVGPVEGVKDSGLKRAAEKVLEAATERARASAPDITVTTDLVTGKAPEELLRASVGAGVVVVASRGVGGFAGLLLGSTGLFLQTYAQCPVLIVRGTGDPGGPIVAGFDGSPASERLLEHTAGVAAQAGRPLVIVHSYPSSSAADEARAADAPSPEALLEQGQQIALRTTPDITVSTRAVEHRSAAGALVEASDDASLVAVGPRSRGHVRGAIGSTAQAVIQHASCPVLLVKESS